jgi:hypothetical protein
VPIQKTCEACGKAFQVKPSKASIARFCSKDCLYNHRKIELVCKTCGKTFLTNKARGDSKYCSPKCSSTSQQRRALRKCRTCGKEEMVQLAFSKSPFCNKECMIKWQKRDQISKNCKTCSSEFKVPRCRQEAKFCSQSCSATYNIKHNKIGKKTSKSFRREDLENTYFRSSWEANFARYLNLKGIAWEYEKYRFKLSNNKTYIPDFFLPQENKFIEVKGYWRSQALKKFKMFEEEYPNISIEVFGKEEYKQLEEEFKDKIRNWE